MQLGQLGSTTEWLLLRPPAPLVIVKSGRPVREVLMCMDGSPDAWRALRALAAMPWLPEVQVTALGAQDGRAETPSRWTQQPRNCSLQLAGSARGSPTPGPPQRFTRFSTTRMSVSSFSVPGGTLD